MNRTISLRGTFAIISRSVGLRLIRVRISTRSGTGVDSSAMSVPIVINLDRTSTDLRCVSVISPPPITPASSSPRCSSARASFAL